jgi:hypothetical protein
MAALDHYFWENLLLYVEERKVIPIVGSELITVRDGTTFAPLQQWLAKRLVGALRLQAADLREGHTLNDVVSLHARQHLPREELYPRIYSLLRSASFAPSPALQALAEIDDFSLFISLTFDTLLEKALETARPAASVTQLHYCPSDVRDLPAPVRSLPGPHVFHLLGKSSPSPDYAIGDEDMIEFMHAMQTEHRSPKLLFDELRGNHLLFLGCGFDDWLTRFFLRVVRGAPFSENRRHREFVVDSVSSRAAGLVMFLASYSSNTHLVEGLTAEAFVDELARRWKANRPAAGAPVEPPSPLETIQEGAVFLSYASEDRPAAQALADGLREAGVDVWFDRDRLRAGDRWERQVRRGIETASLFLPLLSQAALGDANRRSWFWVEWNAASALSAAMSPDEVFILPVAADDVDPRDPGLPDAFTRSQCERLPDGRLSPGFAPRIKELVRDFHRRHTLSKKEPAA